MRITNLFMDLTQAQKSFLTIKLEAPDSRNIIGSIEGPLLPLLGGQGNLAAEPPGRKDRSGDLRAGLAGAGAPTCSPTPDCSQCACTRIHFWPVTVCLRCYSGMWRIHK